MESHAASEPNVFARQTDWPFHVDGAVFAFVPAVIIQGGTRGAVHCHNHRPLHRGGAGFQGFRRFRREVRTRLPWLRLAGVQGWFAAPDACSIGTGAI